MKPAIGSLLQPLAVLALRVDHQGSNLEKKPISSDCPRAAWPIIPAWSLMSEREGSIPALLQTCTLAVIGVWPGLLYLEFKEEIACDPICLDAFA